MKCAKTYKCTPLQGVLSHELKQFIIDGSKVILGKVDIDQGIKVDEFEFETNQVQSNLVVLTLFSERIIDHNALAGKCVSGDFHEAQMGFRKKF